MLRALRRFAVAPTLCMRYSRRFAVIIGEEEQRYIEVLEKKIAEFKERRQTALNALQDDSGKRKNVKQDAKLQARDKETLQLCEEQLAEWNVLRELSEQCTTQSDHNELEKEYRSLIDSFDELKERLLLSDRYDACSCFISITIGAGGTESLDWVKMLNTMYRGWAKLERYIVSEVDATEGLFIAVRNRISCVRY
jgi:protein subunit release factor B